MSNSRNSAQRDVHLVGSIPLATVQEVFQWLGAASPDRLKRIPDGEVGERRDFVRFQGKAVFEAIGITKALYGGPGTTPKQLTAEETAVAEREVQDTMRRYPVPNIKYDEHAISSYRIFREMRQTGAVLGDRKLQVCLPTANNVFAGCVAPAFRSPQLHSYYHKGLISAIKRIQAGIQHADLAIQIDMAAEPIFMQQGADMTTFVRQVGELADAVAEDVELGFHHCYGDVNGKHAIEPPDMGVMADFTMALLNRISRPIDWMHMPVPQDRDDFLYFIPLKKVMPHLAARKVKLFLGLVHRHDLDGTIRRMRTARGVLEIEDFGVATECGLGRQNREDLYNILEILDSASVADL